MDKGEVRAAVVHEVGCKTDDMLEAARFDVARREGGIAALLSAAKQVAELSVHVDKDMDAGAFSNLDGPLAIAAAIKKYVSRAVAVLESGMKSEDNHRLICQGRVQAFELLVGNLRKVHAAELEKTTQRKLIEEGVVVPGHVAGVHPGMSIKERRLQEAAQSAPAEPAPPVPTAAPKRTRKRR